MCVCAYVCARVWICVRVFVFVCMCIYRGASGFWQSNCVDVYV